MVMKMRKNHSESTAAYERLCTRGRTRGPSHERRWGGGVGAHVCAAAADEKPGCGKPNGAGKAGTRGAGRWAGLNGTPFVVGV